MQIDEVLPQIQKFLQAGADNGAYVGLQVGGYSIPIANADKQPRDFQSTVVQWREARDLPNGVPTGPYSRDELQYTFRKLREEYLELKVEMTEIIQSTNEKEIPLTESTKEYVTKILHEAADLMYICFNISAVLGFDLTEVWDAIADSNDTKNGVRKYGNITKGDAHVPADIGAIVDRQIKMWQDYKAFEASLAALPVGGEINVNSTGVQQNDGQDEATT